VLLRGLGLIKIALKPCAGPFLKGRAHGLRLESGIPVSPTECFDVRGPSNQAKRGPCSIQIAVNMARKSTGTGKRQQ